MLERTLIGLATLSALTLGLRPAQAQSTFKSGYYEITSGLYSECCGIAANTFSYELPDERLGFVGLIVDPGGHTARLTFLSPDLRTVFTSYPWFPEETFAFSFNNGIVFSNYIQFGEGSPAPSPGLAEWNYTVRDQAGALSINGVATALVSGADVPNQFMHTNVVAALVLNPVVIDRIERVVGSMRFHFTGQQLYVYTVEYSDSLTTPNWQTNSSYVAKLGPIDVVVTNSLGAAPMRYFRVRTEPCYCR
ncbi:MAG TPA: hypothetical protein VFT34_05305 [Verrucomicrobiae bacterium]|nr:hypothetical protein [Verrucomicrobiae bacterium]